MSESSFTETEFCRDVGGTRIERSTTSWDDNGEEICYGKKAVQHLQERRPVNGQCHKECWITQHHAAHPDHHGSDHGSLGSNQKCKGIPGHDIIMLGSRNLQAVRCGGSGNAGSLNITTHF